MTIQHGFFCIHGLLRKEIDKEVSKSKGSYLLLLFIISKAYLTFLSKRYFPATLVLCSDAKYYCCY